jgi:glycosyltransferase involved in cell wall biosynthesis
MVRIDKMDNPVVVVLGVHRSGTSLTTHVLNALGVRLSDQLIPGRSDNPAGFFEHRKILEKTRAMDGKLGIDPFKNGAIAPSGSSWWQHPDIEVEKSALKQILSSETTDQESVFGFKDPRTLYYLPLWQEIFDDLALTPRYVLALRNVADVVASMCARGISEARARTIWVCQMATGLKCLPQGVDAVVHYERWFQDPETQGVELAKALDLSGFSDEGDIRARLEKIVQPDLRHHDISGDFKSQGELSSAEQFYELICRFARGKTGWDPVHAFACKIAEAAELFEPYIQELLGLPSEFESALDGAKQEVQSLQDQLNQVQRNPMQSTNQKAVEQIAPRFQNPYEATFPKINTLRASAKAPGRPLKVCIATEDIVGPIRNGGIGTTYTHLALLLAEAGHDTTILYLRGDHCEIGTISDWVAWYREKGVNFVPAVLPKNIFSPAQRWIRPMYAFYRHLREAAYDLVHVSEWHGSAYLCLVAKKQGLAFKNTVFCVKSSSPWLWNRKNQLRTINKLSDLIKMYAERKSIELADLVVSGSAYLLRWMMSQGYQLPEGRTFVQPNVVKPVDVPRELHDMRPEWGSRVPVSEIVFFGRLEERKGLDIFCDAVSRLVSKGVDLPPITFMGKYGARIATRSDLTVEQYIREMTKNWPMESQTMHDFNQMEAITYLHGKGRLAVIPSRIENSPLTVYETTQFAIPFIASNVGGASELIAKEHRAAVLTKAHPISLSDKIEEALSMGGFVAAPSFDNDKNLGQWLNFHSQISIILDQEGWPPKSIAEKTDMAETGLKSEKPVKTTICLVLRDERIQIELTLNLLLNRVCGNFEIVLVYNSNTSWQVKACLKVYKKMKSLRKERVGDFRVYPYEDLGQEDARNFAARHSNGNYLLFIDPNVQIREKAVETLANVAEYRQADVLLPVFERPAKKQDERSDPEWMELVVSLAGDPNFRFFNVKWHNPVLYVRKETFEELGGFTTDYGQPGAVEEFIARAILANKLVETVPEPLADVIPGQETAECSDPQALRMRKVRPYVDAAPLSYQPLLFRASFLEEQRRELLKEIDNLRKQCGKLKRAGGQTGKAQGKIRKTEGKSDDRRFSAILKRCFKWTESRAPWPFSLIFPAARRLLKR